MKSPFLWLGAVCAFVAVAMGAFGAHGLKAVLTPERLAVYQTAVNYQMWHALGLIAIAYGHALSPIVSKLLAWAGWLMFTGIVLFSGSLYLLVLLNLNELGMITPFGGASFLAAWLLLAVFAQQNNKNR